MQVRNMVKAGLCGALLCVCSWLSLPLGAVTFTLQTFAVFLTLGLLGGKWGSVAIGVYLLCGAVGLPVFSGFQGGIGVLLGPNGGYLWGFFLAGIVYWLTYSLWKKEYVGFLCGLFTCYAVGTVWFWLVYARQSGIFEIISICVLPYIVPDMMKLWLAGLLSRRLWKKEKGGSL